MDLWNLLVILCFFVLYLGISLVFSQVRRLRDELKLQYTETKFPDPRESALSFAQAADKAEMDRLADQLLTGQRKIRQDLSAQLSDDLKPILSKLEYIEHRQNQIWDRIETTTAIGHVPSGGMLTKGETGTERTKEEAYREAKLLLANGVSEERVIVETGLTVEEVSLLKRLQQKPIG
jgi:hypothetical protein